MFVTVAFFICAWMILTRALHGPDYCDFQPPCLSLCSYSIVDNLLACQFKSTKPKPTINKETEFRVNTNIYHMAAKNLKWSSLISTNTLFMMSFIAEDKQAKNLDLDDETGFTNWPAVVLLILDWKFQRLATRMEITIHNGRTWSSMCFANKLFYIQFRVKHLLLWFSLKYYQFEICDIQFEKKQFVRRIWKSLQAASCFQEVFHTTWEKKSFHFRKCSENTQKTIFSMKFPKITYSFKHYDSNTWTWILLDFADNYKWWF